MTAIAVIAGVEDHAQQPPTSAVHKGGDERS
jgi:hypothetical protein